MYLHALAAHLVQRERVSRKTNTCGEHLRSPYDHITDSFWLLFDLLKGWLTEPEPEGIESIRLSQIEYEINERYEDIWQRVQQMFLFV